ncbi:MAG: radical SAM protein, partial [Candidatus Bathyarchaeia archaeon]
MNENHFEMLSDLKRLKIPWPISGGVILTYKCTSECSHCMYASSPKWPSDWMSLEFFEKILIGLGDRIKKYSPKSGVGLNYGLHFTGGEPFLNYELLLNFVKLSYEYKLCSNFVETNCFWCTDDKIVEERFIELKRSGLGGVL